MAAHLFNESGQMQEVDIPDIFDVLAGGEDESAVKLLLGFSAEDEAAVALMNENGGGLSITPGLKKSDSSKGFNWLESLNFITKK